MKQISKYDIDQILYEKYSFEKDLIYIRPVLLICILLYGIFGVLDFVFYEQYLSLFLTIRFLFVIPVFAIGYAWSFHKSFKVAYQYVLMSMLISGGFGIILMINAISGPNYYYGGLYLVLSVAFFLLRLKPLFAGIGSSVLIVSFFLIGIWFTDITLHKIIAETIFYASFTFIGIIGSIYHEQYRVNQYYQESILIGENIVLEKQVYEQYEDIKNYHSATIYAIARLAESRDSFTGEHINRVGELSFALAEKLPLEMYRKNKINRADFLSSIKLASILHDIGKISISDIILNKPGKLTNEEFKEVTRHTIIGYETLLSIQKDYERNMFISLGLQISKSHHEWWDGRGYPEGLKGEEIPLAARIVALIDVYDALISERPYKGPFTKSKSIGIIKDGIGTQFDPKIAKIFLELIKDKKL